MMDQREEWSYEIALRGQITMSGKRAEDAVTIAQRCRRN